MKRYSTKTLIRKDIGGRRQSCPLAPQRCNSMHVTPAEESASFAAPRRDSPHIWRGAVVTLRIPNLVITSSGSVNKVIRTPRGTPSSTPSLLYTHSKNSPILICPSVTDILLVNRLHSDCNLTRGGVSRTRTRKTTRTHYLTTIAARRLHACRTAGHTSHLLQHYKNREPSTHYNNY